MKNWRYNSVILAVAWLSCSGFLFFSGKPQISIPAGVIVPFNSDGSVPDGWQAFTTANNKFIVGAGSTYSVGSSAAASGSATTVEAGAHIQNSTSGYKSDLVGSNRMSQFMESDGSHSHTVSTAGYTPAKQKFVLIKSSEATQYFPAGAVVLSSDILRISGLSLVEPNNSRLLWAATETGAVAEVASAAGVTTENGGNHVHGTLGAAYGSGAALDVGTREGDHNHTVNLSFSNASIKRAYLAAWSNASIKFSQSRKMIAMWEGETPPSGWVLCDGNNGTIDLRDYFIMLSDLTNIATRAGDNSLSVALTMSDYTWEHNHYGSNNARNDGATNIAVGSVSPTHNHTGTCTGGTYVPAYYALTFIMYIGA